MIYRIREKFWSWDNSFVITDEQGVPCFQVQGKVFSWGDKLSFQDMRGQEQAFISQELFSFMPKYSIERRGRKFAEVLKEWSWFNKKFTLDVPGPNDYHIEGSFWEHDFQFLRGGRVVARISKKLFAWTDSYSVEIQDVEDDVAILCTCIVIDQVLHDEARNR